MDDCVAEGRLALILGMYQKEGLGRERATVERRRRQAVGGTNKLSAGASCMVYNKNISYVFAYFVADHVNLLSDVKLHYLYLFAYIFPRDDAWPLFFMYTREYLGYASYLIGV